MSPVEEPLKPNSNLSQPAFIDVEYGGDMLVDPLSKPDKPRWAVKDVTPESEKQRPESEIPELPWKVHWVIKNGRAERISGPEKK